MHRSQKTVMNETLNVNHAETETSQTNRGVHVRIIDVLTIVPVRAVGLMNVEANHVHSSNERANTTRFDVEAELRAKISKKDVSTTDVKTNVLQATDVAGVLMEKTLLRLVSRRIEKISPVPEETLKVLTTGASHAQIEGTTPKTSRIKERSVVISAIANKKTEKTEDVDNDLNQETEPALMRPLNKIGVLVKDKVQI
jgi:hypothetical protein